MQKRQPLTLLFPGLSRPSTDLRLRLRQVLTPTSQVSLVGTQPGI